MKTKAWNPCVYGNCRAIERALMDELELRGIDALMASPWYFPTTGEYHDKLTAAGFGVPYIELIPRPTPLPKGMPGFLETFADCFASLIAADQRGEFLAAVCDRLEPLLRRSNEWIADYVRLRFEAYKS